MCDLDEGLRLPGVWSLEDQQKALIGDGTLIH